MSSIDRRHFLGAAAAGATLALSHRALRAAEEPSQKIAVAVMGVNNRGLDLARVFARLPGSEVAYICDVDQQAADKCLAAVAELQERKPALAPDFRATLDDPAVDALVIAAPDHWHAPAAILGCAAGKHVYVEKPACHNAREGELMVQAARTHDRVVQLGTQRRSDPGVAAVMQRLHAGEIGRVLFARAWITSARPNIGFGQTAEVPPHLDYTLWQGPAPDVPYRDNVVHYHWHWFWQWGTGELGNNGIHALDLCRWGMQADVPDRVVCGGGKYFFDDDQQTPDTQLATFHFGDRAIHWEHRTWHKRGLDGHGWGMVFYGDNGTLELLNDKYAVLNPAGETVAEGTATNGESLHQTNFLDCIRGGGRPNADIETGVKSTLLCHLGNIAYRTGQTVLVDPATAQLVGGEQERALWSREYRPGWEPQA